MRPDGSDMTETLKLKELIVFPEYKDECQVCTRGGRTPRALLGVGPRDAQVIVVGDTPDPDDHAMREPFYPYGWHGKHLRWLFDQIQLPEKTVRLTFATACLRSGVGDTIVPPTPEEIDLCRHWLDQELTGVASAFRESHPNPQDEQAMILIGGAAVQSVLEVPWGTPPSDLMGHWVSSPRFPEFGDRIFVLYPLHTLDRDLLTSIIQDEWDEAIDRLWRGLRILDIVPEDGGVPPEDWAPCEGAKQSGILCKCNAVFAELAKRPDFGAALPGGAAGSL